MTEPWVKVGNVWLNLADVKRASLPSTLNRHEVHAIQFCKDWLSGKEIFEFHTSGSTGTPKKLTFQRAQLVASAKLTEAALGLRQGYTALVCLDTTLIAGAMMLVRCLVTGMNIIIKSPAANPLESTVDHIDFAAFVPLQVNTMLAHDPSCLKVIDTIIIGGAPISHELKLQLQSLPTAVYSTYGMTETITHIALQKISGNPLQDFFECLDGIAISTDSRGCLVIQAAHFGPSPIMTNDLVTLLDQKRFRWVGRLDRVINSGGVKVSPEKVEDAIEVVLHKIHPAIRFFVAGMPDGKLGQQVVVVLEASEMSTAEQDKIKKLLASRLDKYEIPRAFLFISHFKETASQKIDRIGTLSMILNK